MTFCCNQPRQSGKTTFILKQAAKDGDAVIIEPNIKYVSYMINTCIEMFEGSFFNNQLNCVVLKNGNRITFTSDLEDRRVFKGKGRRNIYIDELSQFLSQFGNIKGYTDTALSIPRMEPLCNLDKIKEMLTEEQINNEFILEWKEN